MTRIWLKQNKGEMDKYERMQLEESLVMEREGLSIRLEELENALKEIRQKKKRKSKSRER